MLSTSTIKTSTQASHYFSEKDNYYSQDEGLQQSEWWGKGAGQLEYRGQIEVEAFADLLNGRLPNGEILGKMVDGVIKHRPGWDLTFSAPKSVSIMALVGGDQRLVTAHREAVKTTLAKIEQGCAQARIKVNGEMQYENTRHLTAALYHHDLSRAKDPQLHTHSVIINATARADGQWRSLGSSLSRYDAQAKNEVNGFIERVRHYNRYYSKLYETELAYRVKQCGYELRNDTESGIFEIAAVPKELIEQFSKRRQVIEAMLHDKGLSGGKAAAVATLATRDSKEPSNRETLLQNWQEQLHSLGVDLKQLLDNSLLTCEERMQTKTSPANETAAMIVSHSTQQLSRFHSVFLLEDLVEHASKEAILHNINVKTLLAAIDHDNEKGNLISLAKMQGKTAYMAKSTLEDEKELCQSLRNNLLPKNWMSSEFLEQYFMQHDNIPQQLQQSLFAVLGSDRVIMVESNNSKEQLVAALLKLTPIAKKEMVIISPNLVSGKHLAKQIQPIPHTFWENLKALFVDTTPAHYSAMQFIAQAKNRTATTPSLWVVNDAHLLSTYQKAKLVTLSEEQQAKLVLIGQKDCLLPYQVSTSLQHLSDQGVKTIHIAPDKDKTTAGANALTPLLVKLSQQIVEANHLEDRQKALAKHYTSLTSADRKISWITTASKQRVEQINHLVHEQLVQQGKIAKNLHCQTLVPIYISPEQAKRATAYSEQQILRFNTGYASLGIQKGDYLKVVRINPTANRVVLENAQGKVLIWRPDRVAAEHLTKLEVFVERSREFCIGEMINVLRSMPKSKLVKGERCQIEDISGNRLKVRDFYGKLKLINLSEHGARHLDYGYAATLHDIAHLKSATLLADLPANSLSTHQRRVNQLVSQSNNVWLYTDDAKKILVTLEKQTGDRLSAKQILNESKARQSALHALYNLLEEHLVKSGHAKNDSTHKAIDAVDHALHHLTERQAAFTHKELMQVAMQHAIGNVSQSMLQEVTVAMKQANILIKSDRSDGTLWTTVEAVKQERELIALVRRDQNQLPAIATPAQVEKYLDKSFLRSEQLSAITEILTSNDRVLSIQGRAGTGKTTMMTSLDALLSAKEIFHNGGFHLQGIAPTHKAVHELTSRGIKAQTIDSFLNAMQEFEKSSVIKDFSKTLLVIDEASMVSNAKMLEILQVAHQHQFSRVIPTGDVFQNPAIEAGKPHELIQRAVKQVIALNDIQRQKNPVLRQGALALYEGNIAHAFEILKDHIVELKEQRIALAPHDESREILSASSGHQDRVKQLVQDYFVLSDQGEKVQIIAPSHIDRKAINAEVRAKLNQRGQLRGDDASIAILSAKDMSRAERSKADNYKAGDVLKFVASSGQHIRAGDYFTIKTIDPLHNLLTLMPYNGDNREIAWQVPKSYNSEVRTVEVYQREERSLKVGDKIVWMRTNKKEALISAEMSEITRIEGSNVSTKRADNTEFVFNASHPAYQHWDHAYALTTYSTQGGTYDTVLGFFESYRKNLMNLKTFLVTVTRAVHNLRIYTDDTNQLQRRVTQNHGNKMSSLEVLGAYPPLEPNGGGTSRQATGKPHPIMLAHRSNSQKLPGFASNQIPKYDRHTLQEIVTRINQEAEKIAIEMLGQPKVRSSNFLKFGTHQGSLSVTIKGERQGWWNDFSEGKGGRSMLSFIQHHAGLSKKDAIGYAASRIGWVAPNRAAPHNIKPKKDMEKAKLSTSITEKSKIEFAKKLALQSQPIAGTLVEKYLKDQRSITLPSVFSDIRYHPGIYSKLNGETHPAMLVIARDHLGNVKAVQATYLDPCTGNKVEKAKIAIQKQTFGVIKGAAVILKGGQGAPTLITEGLETGLSLKQALQETTVKITLSKSNFLTIEPQGLSRKTVLCLDQDGHDSKLDKTILSSAQRLTQAGKQVEIMQPKASQLSKLDYNDVLKTQGVSAIQRDYKDKILAEHFFGTPWNQATNTLLNQKKIEETAKQFLTQMPRQDPALMASYRALKHEIHQAENTKTVLKINDIERNL